MNDRQTQTERHRDREMTDKDIMIQRQKNK